MDALVTFVTSRDFLINFVANLGGALIGVSLALWLDRIKARREATNLYGRMLRTARSELGYLKSMCDYDRDRARAGQPWGSPEHLDVPATRALLLSPLIHDRAPYSLIMTLTVLNRMAADTERTLRAVQEKAPRGVPAGRELLNRTVGDEMNRVSQITAIVLEQVDAQLRLVGLETTPPDAETQEVSRRVREALRSNREPPTG